MASVWDEIESGPSRKAPVARSVWDDIEGGFRKPKDPERSASDYFRDAGVTALKGAVGLPASFVGLADIPTGGRVGKALEEIGYRPEETQKILDTWYSDAQQAANRKVQDAEGFVDTVKTAFDNPSTIVTAAGEALPQMLGGAAIARGLLGAGAKTLAPMLAGPVAPGLLARTVGTKWAPAVAAGVGEGLLGAGAAASQIRAETEDGLLSPLQSGAALASGVGTGLLGVAGGRLANRLGLGDVDTALAQGAMGAGQRGLARNVFGSALSEGVFEELPQSMQEQVWQNVALDRPWDEGVGKAGAMGMLAGGLTGGGFGALNNRAVESDLLRREELQADQERLRGIARQEQERQLLEDEQLGNILDVRRRLSPALGQFDIQNIGDDISAQDLINQELGISPALAAKELEKQRKAREADILAAFNEPSGMRVAGEDGQERELSAIEASLMQQGLPTTPIIETPAPAAPPSRVYSPEEQELITMGIVPNGNALNLLGEIKASNLPIESLTPVITAMTERKNAQAKKLLAQAIIESKKAPAAAPAAPTVAPTPTGGLRVAVTPDSSSSLVPPNLRLPTAEQIAADQQANPQAWGPSLNTQASTPPVAQAPGVTSPPVQEDPANVQASQAVQAEAQGEAPLATAAAQGAASAAESVEPTEAERATAESVGQWTSPDRERAEPINPKVEPLVSALNKRNVFTTMSGDLYGDDLVYVDLDLPYGAQVSDLPSGWVVGPNSANHTQAVHGVGNVGELWADGNLAAEELQLQGFSPKVRISRAGGAVTAEEAAQVADIVARTSPGNTSAPSAAPAAQSPTEPVVQRKRRVVNAAALQQAQAFVAPEAVAEEEVAVDPNDETDWEDSKPDGAPALTALTPSLRQVWSEARAAKAQGRRVNLFKVAEDLVAEQGDEVADDDTLTTLNQIFGERDAAMLFDRYVDNQTEEAIANKYGLSRQAVAKVTGEGELGRKTRATKIKNAQAKYGWTDDYVQQLAARLSPAQTQTEADPTSGRTGVDLEATESAFGADNSAEAGGRDPSLREAGFSTSASLGGSVSNWRDSGELAGRDNITQADQIKLDGLYARRAAAEEAGNDSEVESADAEISMVETKYLSPNEVAAKFTQKSMDLQDRVAKRQQQIEQARAAGKTEVSVNNKLVPIAQLEQEAADLQARAQASIEHAESVLVRGNARKARGAEPLKTEAPKAMGPKVRRVKKADVAAPAAPAAATAPTEVLTPSEGASRSWDQAANTIPGAPKWADLPPAQQREFVGYGENNWTRQDVVAMMQRSAPKPAAAAPAPAPAPAAQAETSESPVRKEGPSGYSFPSSAVVSGIRNEFEPAEVQEVAIGETSDGFVNFGIVNSDGRYYIQSKRKVITFSNGNWGTPEASARGMDVQGTYDPNNLKEEIVRVLTEQGAKRTAASRNTVRVESGESVRKLKKGQKVSIGAGKSAFTATVTDIASLERFPGIAAAFKRLRAQGLQSTLDDVSLFLVTDESVDFDGALMPIGGDLALAFRGGVLTDTDTSEWAAYHELGHVADGVKDGGGEYSGDPRFNVRIVNGRVTPLGALMREAHDAYTNDPTGELGSKLRYPFDFSEYGALDANRLREEVFAQLWAMHLDRAGRDYLEDNHPAIADYMESVHDAIKAERSQASSAGAAQAGAGASAQEQGVGQAAPANLRAQGVDGQNGARFLARQQLPAELQKPVGTITNVLNDTKNAALNMLTFTEDVINRAIDLGVTSADKLRTIYQERTALTGKLEREVERVADLYNQVPEAERGTGPRSVNLFLYDATREGKWGFKPAWRKGTSANVKVDADMKQRYDALSKESKALVEAIFRHGDEVLSLKKQTVMAATDSEYDALIAAAQKAGDAKKAARLTADKADQIKRFNSLFELQEFKPYAPLKRFGDYVVIARSQKYLDADEKTRAKLENSGDDYHVSFAESAAAAREMVEQLNKQGAFAEVVFRQKEAVQQTMFGGMMSAFNKLRSELDSELANAQPGEKAAIRAARKVIGELYLSSLAEASARKSEMRRRGVAGEIDMLRSFTSQGRADAQFIAGAKYNNQTLDAFNAMRREVKSGDAETQNTKSGVFNELMKRHTQSMDYDPSPIADKLARTTSIWFLATSPAYYLQNLTQPFMMSMPVMAGRFNYLKVGNALLKAYADLAPMFRKVKVGEQFDYASAPADVRAAISTLVDRQRIDIGMDTDLGTFRLEGEGRFKDGWNRVDRGIRNISQKMEAINRLATAIAAYRMDIAQTGDTKSALEYADSIITQTHGDYSRTNAPRAFNTAPGKIALQFRKFQLIQLTLLAKLIKNSGFSSKEEKAAFKALGFMLGHTAVMAGAIGLPGFAAISWALGALMGGGDDEPFNLEQWLREQTGNDQLATLITRGAPAALGVDLSQKLGSGNVLSLLPFNDLDLSSRSGVESAAFAAFGGPAGGLTLRAVDGLSLMRDGQYYRGLEQLMPTGVTNAMKAYRVADEGVTRRNGDVLISPEEISGMDTFWQAIGFQPTQIAERQFRDRVKREADDKFQSRAEKIRNAYLRAKDDPGARAEARERWMTLQDARESAGYRRQPLSSLMRAEQNQRERERNTLGGIQFNRDSRRFVEDLVTEEED